MLAGGPSESRTFFLTRFIDGRKVIIEISMGFWLAHTWGIQPVSILGRAIPRLAA